MIITVVIEDGNEVTELRGSQTIQRLNRIMQLIAAAYSNDPGTSDLDDEQPVSAITGLDLGDVRLARRLTRHAGRKDG